MIESHTSIIAPPEFLQGRMSVAKQSRPIVRNNLLLLERADRGADKTVQIGSSQWYEWLSSNQRFLFEGGTGHFTARREQRRGSGYWYAYRRRGGKLAKTYLGKSEELSAERLEQASAHLAGQTPLSADFTNWRTISNTSDVAVESTATMSIWARTKTRLPALPPILVKRPRLTRQISTPVTIIHAPSGYGKTTLLNEWRQTCNKPVAWAWLDASDNTPSRFWSTIIKALQTIFPNLGRELLFELQALSFPLAADFIVKLTSEITRVTGITNSLQSIGLIVDDYHHVTDPSIHATVEAFCEHLPSTVQLIISSRTVSSLMLANQRASDNLTMLEIDELRLTSKEATAFLEELVTEHPLTYSETQLLIQRTDGWIAGLKLAGLALNQQIDRRELTTTFTGTHTYLREYFIDSVLNQLPAATQAFLFKTSILKQLTGDLCNAVTGQIDGTEQLSQIWQQGMFLVCLEAPGWYRYHELFAEMLNQQLQLHFPTEVSKLHRLAADWYLAQHAPTDALHHLFAIQAYEEAAELIEHIALQELAELGEESRVLHWLRQLPEMVVQHHRTLLRLYLRLGVLALPDVEIDHFLTQIEQSVAQKSTRERTRDERTVLQDIRRFRSMRISSPASTQPPALFAEADETWQTLTEKLRLRHNFGADLPRAEALAREIYDSARTRHDLYILVLAGGICANRAFLQGHLRRSKKLAYQVLQQAQAQRGSLPDIASISLMVLSRICYARNQLAQADRLLMQITEVDPSPASSNMLISSAVIRAKIQAAQGDTAEAIATLQEAQALHARQPSRIWSSEGLMAYQALFNVRHGDWVDAERLLNETSTIDNHPLTSLAWAEMLLRRKDAAAAADHLRRLIADYPYGLPQEPLLSAYVMLAIALFEQHQINLARHVMLEAIRFAEPELFIRPFLDYGFQSMALLSLVLQSDMLPPEPQAFVKEIVRMVSQVEGAPEPPSKIELAALTQAASVSPREQEVLKLVGMGLSNREISAQLSISNSTVKAHLENIFLKLGVTSRMQAVAQAQALKLI